MAVRDRHHAAHHRQHNVQLLTVVIPCFEQLRKEGQSGQAKMTQYTCYLTVALALLQSTASSPWPRAVARLLPDSCRQ